MRALAVLLLSTCAVSAASAVGPGGPDCLHGVARLDPPLERTFLLHGVHSPVLFSPEGPVLYQKHDGTHERYAYALFENGRVQELELLPASAGDEYHLAPRAFSADAQRFLVLTSEGPRDDDRARHPVVVDRRGGITPVPSDGTATLGGFVGDAVVYLESPGATYRLKRWSRGRTAVLEQGPRRAGELRVSPDGRRVAFLVLDDETSPDLARIRVRDLRSGAVFESAPLRSRGMLVWDARGSSVFSHGSAQGGPGFPGIVRLDVARRRLVFLKDTVGAKVTCVLDADHAGVQAGEKSGVLRLRDNALFLFEGRTVLLGCSGREVALGAHDGIVLAEITGMSGPTCRLDPMDPRRPLHHDGEITSCADSDGGKEPYTRGALDLRSAEGKVSPPWGEAVDGCRDPATLVEYSCPLRDDVIPCRHGCVDGACVRGELRERSCTDSDGGPDFGKPGVVRWFEAGSPDYLHPPSTDRCLDEKVLEEWTCGRDAPEKVLHTCDAGCLSGACFEEEIVDGCRDEDGGKDYYRKAIVRSSHGRRYRDWDFCVDDRGHYAIPPTFETENVGAYLLERYCDEKGMPQESFRRCPEGCRNGACIPPRRTALTCADLDGGLDPGVASRAEYTVRGGRHVLADRCINDWVLDEALCQGGTEADSTAYRCPLGCKDGRCRSEAALGQGQACRDGNQCEGALDCKPTGADPDRRRCCPRDDCASLAGCVRSGEWGPDGSGKPGAVRCVSGKWAQPPPARSR